MNSDLAPYFVGGALLLSGLIAVSLVRKGDLASRVLALALAAAALNILHGAALSELSSGLSREWLVEPLQTLLPPLFLAYVKALLDRAWRPRPRDWLHFLPAIALSAATVAVLAFPGAVAGAPPWLGLAASAAFWLALSVQAAAYVGRAMAEIRRYRRRLREAVSTLRGVDQAWLWWYSFSLHVLYGAYAFVPAVLLHAGGAAPARHLAGAGLCVAVTILAARQALARQDEAAVEDGGLPDGPAAPGIGDGREEPEPTGDSRAKSGWDPALPEALEEAMNARRLYLSPGLTLVTLAEAVGWPRNEVSAAINGHFGVTFHDFVNGYRVEEAKRLMLDPSMRNFTLVALAMEAGFNSKPAFNSVFKKATGMSPTSWLAARNHSTLEGARRD